jgi:hypothetical protein
LHRRWEIRVKSAKPTEQEEDDEEDEEEEEEDKESPACRGEGGVVVPLLAARALSLRCAASTILTTCTGYA